MNKIFLITSLLFFSSSVFAQSKTLEQIRYEARYGSIIEEKQEEKAKGKYDHLPVAQRERYQEIDKKNAELLEKAKDPKLSITQPKDIGVIVDPKSGAIIAPAVSQSLNSTTIIPSTNLAISTPSIRNSFGAIRHRKISDLVTSWSGKEGQYLLWSYSKDYDIYNPSLFNQESKLNQAVGLDDAIQKVFRYIAFKEAKNPKHLPPKICFEGNSIIIVDTNVECD